MQAARKIVTQNHIRGKERQNPAHATTERGKEIHPGKAQPQEGKMTQNPVHANHRGGGRD
jgi:hypothetical protein